jgi:hypothetical protein
MKRTISNLVVSLLIGICCKAQTDGFAYKAVLDSVKQPGFYNIEILPSVHVHCKTDYSDIRIVNGQGKWVPHLLRIPSNEKTNHAVLMEMPFVSKTSSETAVTCVVKNNERQISSIEILMRNTTAQRICSISGSMDGKEWFIINDSIMLQEVAVTEGDKTRCRLNFPPSGYSFFKIVIDSKKTDPVNIIDLSVYTDALALVQREASKELIENPNCNIVQKDSAKASYIQVTQSDAYQFEWLALQVSGIKYFSRNVDVYVPQSETHAFDNPGHLLQSFTISNNSTLQFYLPHIKAKVFYLVVHNNDNLPLQVVSVKTALRYRLLTAYLEKGDRYQLFMDNPLATPPVYDLAQLSAKLPQNIPVLAIAGQVGKTGSTNTEPVMVPKRNNRYLLWGSIGAALLALLYFTAKLLREVNKQKGLEQEQ